MSFEFFSAGNVVLDQAPFYTYEDDSTTAEYNRKKTRVMEYLVGFSNRARLGTAFNPTKDSYPDHIDMAIIRTTNPERWAQLEQDAVSDLALNGFYEPLQEATQHEADADVVVAIPSPRPETSPLDAAASLAA